MKIYNTHTYKLAPSLSLHSFPSLPFYFSPLLLSPSVGLKNVAGFRGTSTAVIKDDMMLQGCFKIIDEIINNKRFKPGVTQLEC